MTDHEGTLAVQIKEILDSSLGEFLGGIEGKDDAAREIVGLIQSRLTAAEAEIARLRDRLGPQGLEVVMINGSGHYVNEVVKGEIDRLRADIPDDVVVLRSDRENLAKRVAGLIAAIQEAIDLLAERTHGNGARSPGHNARLVLETALSATQAPEPVMSAEEVRPCTCHPSDKPPTPCPQKFAYSECVEDSRETMDDFIRAVLAGNNPRTDEPYRTVGNYIRGLNMQIAALKSGER